MERIVPLKKFVLPVTVAVLVLSSCADGFLTAQAVRADSLVLRSGQFKIVLPPDEPECVVIAARTLAKDIQKVLGFTPEIVPASSRPGNDAAIVIVNHANSKGVSASKVNLDGFESHRLVSDAASKTFYLHGSDPRGTIFAIYTFCDKFLGVPPLWFFSSWQPRRKDEVVIPAKTDLLFRSPQVRYRAWLPNDTDLLSAWRIKTGTPDEFWFEAMLRLKLNTVEGYSTISYSGGMTNYAKTIARFGLVLTSHHVNPLNSSFSQGWSDYWKKVRKTEPPELLLKNEKELIEFFRYNIETVHRSGIENLWLITFRGAGDKPFWIDFQDAPESEKERADVINRMLNIQYNLICEITGQQNPYVRITFYDELSDLLAKGDLQPPVGENVIWTYVAARRDHFPNEDLVQFDPARRVKLGYYMNLQFTSTGSHLAQGEGPWKMEANYKYVQSKSPLFFSVVNAGNLREFLLTLSANAALLWDIEAYSTDMFLREFCTYYFGEKYADETARLYRNFFNAYWQQRRSTFPGMDRQYFFQDLRYATAFRRIGQRFFEPAADPFIETGFERVPGRTFNIVPEDCQAETKMDALFTGMKQSAERFGTVAAEAERMKNRLPEEYRTFFNDNLVVQAKFMAHLSRSLYHFVDSYKNQENRESAVEAIRLSINELKTAREALLEAEHGVFVHWYDGDQEGKFRLSETIQRLEKISETLKTRR